MRVDHRADIWIAAVHRAVQHALARWCMGRITDRISLQIDAHQHIASKRALEARIGRDPQFVFAWDTHAYVAARRSNESVSVHFLNGANDFGANITGDNSIRSRAAWRGQGAGADLRSRPLPRDGAVL